MRDKLKKVVKEAIHSWDSNVNMSDHIADHLISNGATIQKWIPVGERLPEMYKGVLVYSESGKISINWRGCNGDWNSYGNITYWMCLPEAPRAFSEPLGDTL